MNAGKLIILVVAVLFCVANLLSYLQMPEYSTLDDGYVAFGWPFSVYGSGGLVGSTFIIWTGIIGNFAVALCVARVLGRLVGDDATTRMALLADIRIQLKRRSLRSSQLAKRKW